MLEAAQNRRIRPFKVKSADWHPFAKDVEFAHRMGPFCQSRHQMPRATDDVQKIYNRQGLPLAGEGKKKRNEEGRVGFGRLEPKQSEPQCEAAAMLPPFFFHFPWGSLSLYGVQGRGPDASSPTLLSLFSLAATSTSTSISSQLIQTLLSLG